MQNEKSNQLSVDDREQKPFFCSKHGRSYEPCECWAIDMVVPFCPGCGFPQMSCDCSRYDAEGNEL